MDISIKVPKVILRHNASVYKKCLESSCEAFLQNKTTLSLLF